MSPMPRLETIDDVAAVVLPIAPSMTEQDVRDVVLAIARDRAAGPELLAAYRAAACDVPESAWSTVWAVLTAAANAANIVTSIGGVVQLVQQL